MSTNLFPNNNNNMHKKLTSEQTIILIRLIKKYKILWDPAHKDFRDRTLCDNIYEKIGRYFQLTGQDVRMKFRRFRNCYRQELKQIFNGQKDRSGLFYFDEMEFLSEQMEQRLTSGSPTTEDPDEAERHTTESYEELFSIEDEDSDCNEPTSTNKDATLDIMENGKVETDEKTDPGEDQIERASSVSESRMDEFDVFAGYVASQLREMDKISALETMEELQQMIVQRRIGILKRNLKRKAGSTATVQHRYSLEKKQK